MICDIPVTPSPASASGIKIDVTYYRNYEICIRRVKIGLELVIIPPVSNFIIGRAVSTLASKEGREALLDYARDEVDQHIAKTEAGRVH